MSWSTVVAVTLSDSPLLARADQILDERVQLLLGERLAERGRHHIRMEPLGDVLVGIDDRIAYECVERLVRRLRLGRQLVEVGAYLSGGAGRGQRVACTARVVLEDGCSGYAGVGRRHGFRLVRQPL